jgi:hypothetical protein
MTVQFHRGLTTELRTKLALSGLQIEEAEAQKILAGIVAMPSPAQKWITSTVHEILSDEKRHEIMARWTEEHPESSGYPPMFPQEVIRLIDEIDMESPTDTLAKIKSRAQEEMYG